MTVLAGASTQFEAQEFALSPAEVRGLARDEIRLLAASADNITDTQFAHLGEHLRPGDLIVINNSATVHGQLDAHSSDRGQLTLHVATPLDDGTWVIEVRTAPDAARAVLDVEPGERFTVGRHRIEVLTAYPYESSPTGAGNRLWRITTDLDLASYAAQRGRPISYGYLDQRYSLEHYQTIFATVPGSAEMPSAGRPFTDQLVVELIARGVQFAPITLHTGVSSQEAGEGPQDERFEVSENTARLVNATRSAGRRVIAVGTTVTRALESAVIGDQMVAARGWTNRLVTPADPPQVVDGLITGWHDPQASHLLLVEAVAGPELTQRAYDAAVAGGYRWHEFGDSALLLP